MTSKHLFFKIMKEDLRHKIWMIALSVLGSFLSLPVAWLIVRSNVYGGAMATRAFTEREVKSFLELISEFFDGYVPVMGGVLGILFAFALGLFSFRFVFHKSMADNYHSLPVKRRTLYGACYLNGFLIWFVPFFLCLTSVVLMAGSFVGRHGGAKQLLDMLGQTALTLLVLVVTYLLVYHLVLTAVMLSGNVLNTLVSAGILGFGAVVVYLLGIMFFNHYMETFYEELLKIENVIYASPLVSAPYLLYVRAEQEGSRELWRTLLLNLGIALGIGGCAYCLYLKRESEMAGQGIRRKPVAALFQVICGLGAGMSGWGLFNLMVDYSAEGWGSFGAVLCTVLVFGVLDVIFRMDFKAFFAHKLQMALTVVLSLAVCFALKRDWIGYDTYLPDKEEIAQIAIWDRDFANHFISMDITIENFMEKVGFQDMEIVYPYLERMVEHEKESAEEYYECDRVLTKVTLKSGRSYYRYYRAKREDRELLWPMLTDERYLDYAYLVDPAAVNECRDFEVETAGGAQSVSINREKMRETILPIIEAYNRDVLADPESVMLGKGRLLARVSMSCLHTDQKGDRGLEPIYMDVYEGMEDTLEVLRQAGFGEYMDMAKIEEMKEGTIILDLKYPYETLTVQNALSLGIAYHEGDMTREETILLARASYGVCEKESAEPDLEEPAVDYGITEAETARVTSIYVKDLEGNIITKDVNALYITDPDEVKELLSLLSFDRPYHSYGVFKREYVDVRMIGTDGYRWTGYIQKGALPEKYILRFGE